MVTRIKAYAAAAVLGAGLAVGVPGIANAEYGCVPGYALYGGVCHPIGMPNYSNPVSGAAYGEAAGAASGYAAGGPVGAIVGGTVGAAVGAAVEIPNAVITAIPERERSVTVRERVIVGEPLPPTVELRVVPSHTEYRYAVVNDRRVIVDPHTRRVVKIID